MRPLSSCFRSGVAHERNPDAGQGRMVRQAKVVEMSYLIHAEYIEVSANVRYWDSAIINGEEDTLGNLAPFREGGLWKPVIRLDDGAVMGWQDGMEASFHYKVCDQGEYWLLDSLRRRIAKYRDDYVPSEFLCHGDNGYGDYIIFNVGADGLIKDYKKLVFNEESSQCWDFSLLMQPIVEQMEAANKAAESQPDFLRLKEESAAIIRKMGLWDDYLARKEQGEFEFVRGIKRCAK